MFNALYLSPSERTMRELKTRMQASPLHFDFSKFRVVVFTTQHPIRVDPSWESLLFRARPDTLEYPYNTETQSSMLVMPLISDDLQELHAQLCAYYNEPVNPFQPEMVMIPHMPPLKSTYRNFVNSISTSFYGTGFELEFTNPTVATVGA